MLEISKENLHSFLNYDFKQNVSNISPLKIISAEVTFYEIEEGLLTCIYNKMSQQIQ